MHEESPAEQEISDEYLTKEQQQQLLQAEEALRETLEEAARHEKEWEARMKEDEAHDELFRLEFAVISGSESD
ncbi:hypothetical protein Tco_0775176 [Tanacetum coccineum]